MAPIVFINIGWMKEYRGETPTDQLNPGNFAYFKKASKRGPRKIGHEQWNFLARDGWVYGYVPRSSRIDLRRLGASNRAPLEGALVVFVARDPAAKVLKVVGWYEDATVTRDFRFLRKYGRTQVSTCIATRAGNAHLLRVGDRGLPIIPTAQKVEGGVGQSPVWYGEGHDDVVEAVRRLVRRGTQVRRSGSTTEKPVTAPPRNTDPATRLAAEQSAMNAAMAYFDDARDVSLKKFGWDVEAPSREGKLLIEVKGLQGPQLSIELTPNEFSEMKRNKARYIVFVVNSALTRRPLVRIFRYRPMPGSSGALRWASDDNEVLDIKNRIGVWCTLKAPGKGSKARTPKQR